MPAILVLLYLALCCITGYFGRSSRLGYWGCTLLAVIVSPMIVLPVLFLLGSARRSPRPQ